MSEYQDRVLEEYLKSIQEEKRTFLVEYIYALESAKRALLMTACYSPDHWQKIGDILLLINERIAYLEKEKKGIDVDGSTAPGTD